MYVCIYNFAFFSGARRIWAVLRSRAWTLDIRLSKTAELPCCCEPPLVSTHFTSLFLFAKTAFTSLFAFQVLTSAPFHSLNFLLPHFLGRVCCRVRPHLTCGNRYKKFRLKWEKDVMRHVPGAGKKKKGVAKPQ